MSYERNKRRREKRKVRKQDNLAKADPSTFKKLTEFHWRKSVNGLAFDYWPSTRKAMYNGQVFEGVDSVEDLIKYLEKKGV